MIQKLKESLLSYSSEERKVKSLKYFKTGNGQYGEGDIFIGISIPDLRKAIKPYINKVSLSDLLELLQSSEHEFRLAALIILVKRFQKNESERDAIVNIYINNTNFINNWDLVDSSAHYILGPWLEDKDRTILYEFATSSNLWKERISIMSTFHFIKKNRDFIDTLKIGEILISHNHDLIHKAVGWMLREVGNISIETEEQFLKQYYKKMPRTMLRYAIEKFPEDKRKSYLKGQI